MGITALLDAAYYTGGSVVGGLVPDVYDVALNGRPYDIQFDPTAIGRFNLHFSRQPLPFTRDQADQSDSPGEHSVSPEQFWRRSEDNWLDGAGQTYLDRKTSAPHKFRASKGVNPWTPWQLTLHNTTSRTRTSANSGLRMVVAGTRVYLMDGTGVLYSTDGSVWTGTTGSPGTPSSLCTDGYEVYVAYGANGIYSTDITTGALTSFVTGTVDLVGFAKGRLMAAHGNMIYNPTASGALPTALFTAGTGFVWVGFAESQQFIYAAGHNGTTSYLYGITVDNTGATLAAPFVAGTLPAGETVRSVTGYLNFLLVGTDKGLRLATPDSNGNLSFGQLISTSNAVTCGDGQERFIWFGWTNYDTSSTGLGRLDLSNFPTDVLTPAYASDLMATAQGVVGSTVLLGTSRLFTVDGSGVWTEQPGTPVASGTFTTGLITYDLADAKVAAFLDLRHDPLPASTGISVSISFDGSPTLVGLGTSNATGTTQPTSFYLNSTRAERFELTFTLSTTVAASPTLTRWTLRVSPAPATSSLFTVPLVITDETTTLSGDHFQSARDDYESLIQLYEDQSIFTYQEGNHAYQVKMADYDWLPDRLSVRVRGDFLGTFVAKLQEITG